MRAARVLVGARRAAAARRSLATSDGRRLALSFSGSGMMMAYHFGVAAAIAEKSSLMDRVDRVHGTSGGAIVSLVLLEAPEAIRDCLEHYVSGEFFEELRAREVLKPHDVLLKRTLDAVGITRDGAAARLSGKLVAHTTTFEDGLFRPRNNSLTDFADDATVFRAVSASCCLDFVGVDVFEDGVFHHDGGLSDPLPVDATLPTIEVSILTGAGVHAAPGAVAAGLGASAPRPHPFLRYDASLLNARAFLEGAVLTRRRARERFEEGLRDGEELLRRGAEDTLFVA